MNDQKPFIPFSISIDDMQQAEGLGRIIDAAARHMGAQGSIMIASWQMKIAGAVAIAEAAANQARPNGKHAAKGRVGKH